jgi:phage terminase large subunit-like protein
VAILLPYNSGKTSVSSRAFVAWHAARNPKARTVILSHTEQYAARLSRRVQEDIAEHSKLLGIKPSATTTAAGYWELNTGGSFLALGIGGSLLGSRADLIVADDILSKPEDGNSELDRSRVWEYWQTAVMSRLESNEFGSAPVIAIGTPFHHDDWLARIQAQNNKPGVEKFTIVRIPAISEGIGDLLNRPEGVYLGDGYDDPRHYGQWLRNRKAELTALQWSSSYMLRPSPEQGSYFSRSHFVFTNKIPPRADLAVYMASDFAVTEKTKTNDPDYTVHLVCGYDPAGNLYALDMWRGRVTPDAWVEHAMTLVKKWRPTAWGLEKGQLKGALLPLIKRRFRDCNVAMPWRQEFNRKFDKTVIARTIQGKIAGNYQQTGGENGGVGMYIPEAKDGCDWGAFLTELLQFDKGQHDDCVDALALIGLMLDKVVLKLPDEIRNPKPPAIAGAGMIFYDDLFTPDPPWFRGKRSVSNPRI